MKPVTVLRVLLLLPYLMLGISIIIPQAIHALANDSLAQNDFVRALELIAGFYFVAVYFWGVPYTLLTVALLLWSINRPFRTVYTVFFLSPFLLVVLMVVEIIFLPYLAGYSPSIKEWLHLPLPSFTDLLNLAWFSLLAAIPSLVFGYIFVGFGMVIYKIFEYFKIIRSEFTPT
jgi:hypothetical protein